MAKNVILKEKTEQGFEEIWPKTQSDQINGLLQNSTKLSFGLNESATPDNVFNKINEMLNYYRWNKQAITYHTVFTPITGTVSISYQQGTNTIYYSKNITIQNGIVSLVNPNQVQHQLYTNFYTQINALINNAPIYFSSDYYGTQNQIYYLPEGATGTEGTNETYSLYSDGYYLKFGTQTAQNIRGQYVNATYTFGDSELIFSPDINDYPISDIKDGYYYSYLGNLSQNFTLFGSYSGTGTYGANSPTSLNFSFVPKIIIINAILATNPQNSSYYPPAIFIRDEPNAGGWEVSLSNAQNLYLEWDTNTVSWYSLQSASKQLNTLGYTYYYIAIG